MPTLVWNMVLHYGLGYGFQFKAWLFPIVVNFEYSFPSGNKIFDDFKTKIGGQIRWIEFHDFQFSTKIYGVFRRYENDFVRFLILEVICLALSDTIDPNGLLPVKLVLIKQL